MYLNSGLLDPVSGNGSVLGKIDCAPASPSRKLQKDWVVSGMSVKVEGCKGPVGG